MGEILPKTSYENNSRVYSPVTLNQHWSALGRLVLVFLFSTLGTLMNGFFVATFFVDRTLSKRGNVYHVCIGLADLIITAVVMPTSVVVLLSGEWDILPVCRSLQFMTELSTYCYSVFFMLIASETYCRLCCSNTNHMTILSTYSGCISITLFFVCVFLAAVGVFMELDYDYCERSNRGNFLFRATTLGLLHAIPFFWTMYAFICSALVIRRRARIENHYRRSRQYSHDSSNIYLNIFAYLIYVIGWLPYLNSMHQHPVVTDAKYYHAVWLGLMRSVVTSIMYIGINRIFRRAFAQLFYYCCCKSSLSNKLTSRHGRVLEYRPTTGDVRVHLMHHAVATHIPKRSSVAVQPQEL